VALGISSLVLFGDVRRRINAQQGWPTLFSACTCIKYTFLLQFFQLQRIIVEVLAKYPGSPFNLLRIRSSITVPSERSASLVIPAIVPHSIPV
jgi:hypothetical protein